MSVKTAGLHMVHLKDRIPKKKKKVLRKSQQTNKASEHFLVLVSLYVDTHPTKDQKNAQYDIISWQLEFSLPSMEPSTFCNFIPCLS